MAREDSNVGVAYTDKSEVKQILESPENYTRDELAEYCTKLHLLVLSGELMLDTNQRKSLDTLSRKYIPDPKREVDITGKLSVEDVYKGWLEDNSASGADAISEAFEVGKKALEQTLQIEEAIESEVL